MFKIISTEIKKSVAKPGIYILSVLLTIILVLGVFAYKPKVYESSNYSLNGNTFIEKLTDFAPNDAAGKKAEAQQALDNALLSVNNYRINSKTQQEHINDLLKLFNEKYEAYQDCAGDDYDQSIINSFRVSMITSLDNLNEAIDSAISNSQQGSFTIITSEANYNDYLAVYKQVNQWANSTIDSENLKYHFAEFENKYADSFFGCINNFKYPSLSDEFIEKYTSESANSKYSILKSRLNDIEEEIKKHEVIATADNAYNIKNADKMDELANQYTNTINTYTSLIKYELITNAFNAISTKEELTTLFLKDYSNFNSKSLLVRYNYLFDNNKSEENYGKPLTIGITSNDKINAFDYSYFVLRIFSFVIIIYAIMSACFSISGEIKEGSMRYLAMRPVSRTKLFWGKWLAILSMSGILMIFSLIVSLCVGFAVYGGSYKIILTIFNGSTALTIHPIIMVLLYMLSMLLELVIYSLLAMLFSSLFKSDLMSMTILIVIYLLNTIIPIFVEGTNSWLTFYPFSHISLYSLFGSSVYAIPHNFFNKVFGAKVYAGTHIALTLSVIALMVVIVSAIAIKVFKKKEL